jgi:two-component system, LuxR family, response regulator DctR
MTSKATIYLCDDDADVRGGLSFLLRQCNYGVREFAGGLALLEAIAAEPHPLRAIFVLDLHMPPMDGDEVHDQLIARGYAKCCPVIFLSSRGTIARAVRAVNNGALSFVEKPHTNDALLPLLERAFVLEGQWHTAAKRRDFLKSMWDSLSAQQRKVALLVADGEMNKVVADKLGIVERTVEVHRSKSFEKLGVDSPAALATTIAAMRAGGIDVDTD